MHVLKLTELCEEGSNSSKRTCMDEKSRPLWRVAAWMRGPPWTDEKWKRGSYFCGKLHFFPVRRDTEITVSDMYLTNCWDTRGGYHPGILAFAILGLERSTFATLNAVGFGDLYFGSFVGCLEGQLNSETCFGWLRIHLPAESWNFAPTAEGNLSPILLSRGNTCTRDGHFWIRLGRSSPLPVSSWDSYMVSQCWPV